MIPTHSPSLYDIINEEKPMGTHFSDEGDYPFSSLSSPPARSISEYFIVVTITTSGSG